MYGEGVWREGKEVWCLIPHTNEPIGGFLFKDGSLRLNEWKIVDGEVRRPPNNSISLSKETMSVIVNKWLQLQEEKIKSKKWIFKKLLSRNR